MKLPVSGVTRLQLEEPYEGFYVEVEDDPEMGVYEGLFAMDFSRLLAALAQMTRGSNAVDRSGKRVDLATIEGWRKQRRSFTLMAIQKMKGVLELPKAPSNGSSTQSPTEAVKSTVPTT